jgi:hypothetical protein
MGSSGSAPRCDTVPVVGTWIPWNPVQGDARKLVREPQKSGPASWSPPSGVDNFDGFHAGDRFQTSAPTTSVWTSGPLQALPEFSATAGPLPLASASCFDLSSASEGGMNVGGTSGTWMTGLRS